MTRRIPVLLLLLMIAGMDSARAQSLVGIVGGGLTSSGPGLSDSDFHGLAALLFPLRGSLGLRAEGLVSEVPQGTMWAPSGDIVIGIGEEAASGKGGYLLAGGSLILVQGEAHAGFNGGIGYGFMIQRRYSLVLESRYLRILGDVADPSIVLLTLELQVPLRSH